MKTFHCIAFTHQNIGIESIGDYHISVDDQQARLQPLLENGVSEFLFLSTCNRVELWFRVSEELNETTLYQIISTIYPSWTNEKTNAACDQALVFSHLEAVDHVLRVASSVDSLVIGEREILSQIKDAYKHCKDWGFTGDFIRILIRKTIETAKRVYTETEIATRPVSVVNLAYRLMANQNMNPHSRVLFIGAGKTNLAMIRKMHKAGFRNFSVFNRTKANAQKITSVYGGSAYSLNELTSFNKGFDILISCTGSNEEMISRPLFDQLNQNESSTKTIVDLAIPYDINEEIKTAKGVNYISITELKEIAAKNLEARRGELYKCEEIILSCRNEFESINKVRKVELAMRKVPQQVKEIRQRATEVVFAEDIADLDDKAQETLNKVLSFVEKKYMSTPMLLAKEILLKEDLK
ncbi:MAG: glutamyl-tRNA reductase [Salibacteraceae bacterium]